MAFIDAIVSADGNHSSLCEVTALFLKLFGRAAFPASSKKEDDGGFWVFQVRFAEEVKLEFGVCDGAIDFDACVFYLGGIGKGEEGWAE